MKTVKDIFTAAMGLMDELGSEGEAQNRDTQTYERRTPGIVNLMLAEYGILAGGRCHFPQVETLEDPVLRIPDTYALGVMEYGLATNLLVDENPAAASFYQSRYEELRNIFFARRESDGGEAIQDMYGGIEFGRFGRW